MDFKNIVSMSIEVAHYNLIATNGWYNGW